MKTLILAATFMMLGDAEVFRRQGYVVYAPVSATSGYVSNDVQGAFVGGDFLFYKGLGANVDAGGYFLPGEGGGIGAFSPSVTYHARTRRFVPFVSTGPAMFLGGDGTGLGIWQFGGGVTAWIKPRFGIRAELRHHIDYRYNGLNLTSFRFGITWR
jgi:hypothetical protein